MPQYKDEARNTWYCKFYYKDWTGQRKPKLKRGFKTKREAKAWEQEFLAKQQGCPDITFQALYDLYMEDLTPRLKATTLRNKEKIFRLWILPYFKDMIVANLSVAFIRHWQAIILHLTKDDGKAYSPSYVRTIDRQVAAILNFAVRFCGLPTNPHKQAGSIGKIVVRMLFWTKSDFDRFISTIEIFQLKTIYYLLFYTGIRLGELQALTLKDVDFDNCTISISKTYYRRSGHDIVTAPKTDNSNRIVTIPEFLRDMLKDHTNMIYGITENDRIFTYSANGIRNALAKGCRLSNVQPIPIHSLRHSHVSLLIDLGFTPLLIAERIGDSVATVNNTYGHLYPNRHTDVANQLQQIVSS